MAQYLGVSQIETDSVSVTGGVCGPGVDSANTHLTFDLPLRTSLVPKYCRGSGTPAFTRVSNAYVADHEGILRLARSGEARFQGARRIRNSLFASESFSQTGSVTVTTGHAGPSSNNATKCIFGAAASSSRISLPYDGPDSPQDTFTLSVWLRGEVGGESIVIWNGWSTTAVLTLTTSWRRYALQGCVGNSSHGVFLYANSGTPTIYATQGQSEIVSGSSNEAPGEYVSVGVLSAPYHGAGVDGVKYFDTENGNSVNSNVVTEATGAAIAEDTLQGYLSESQRTNRCLYSEDFSNAAWVKTNCTISANSTEAPNGSTTADTLTATGANATCIQDLGVVASAKKTGSVWIKRKTGTGNIQLTMDGGAGWTTVTVTSSWVRFDLSQTLADEDFGIRLVTNGDEVYVWGAQVEQDLFAGSISWATSYIATSGASVTRNEDNLYYAGTGNISALNGTSFCEFYAYSGSRYNSRAIGIGNNSPLTINGMVSIYDGVNSLVAWPAVDTILKGASIWADGGNKQSFCNGVGSTANAFAGFTFSNLNIGGSGSDESASTPIRNVRIWSAVMPIRPDGTVASQISG